MLQLRRIGLSTKTVFNLKLKNQRQLELGIMFINEREVKRGKKHLWLNLNPKIKSRTPIIWLTGRLSINFSEQKSWIIEPQMYMQRLKEGNLSIQQTTRKHFLLLQPNIGLARTA